MTRLNQFSGLLSGVIFACGSFMLDGCADAGEYAVSEEYEAGTAETSTAKLEISGMMCAHACGGKIKKELLEIPGVANASIDFESGRDLNAAEVEYDPNAVTPEELAEKVTGIADGKLYAVASVQVTHFAKAATLPQ
jgi:copper chaperone CopZ